MTLPEMMPHVEALDLSALLVLKDKVAEQIAVRQDAANVATHEEDGA